MTITLFSNYVTHHQIPFCLEMYKLLGENFTFVVTEPFDQERSKIGYENLDDKYDFVLSSYKSPENYEKAMALARNCDVAIFGAAPERFLQERMRLSKLSFRYCERPLKQGRLQLLKPKKLYGMLNTHTKYLLKPLYLLTASAYAYGDCSLVGGYWGKAYKWGYFTEAKQYDLEVLFARKREKNTVSILWAGRLIGWKHPDVSILLAERLKREGFSFQLNIIGEGELRDELALQIKQKGLEEHVHMLGAMHPEKVRTHMEEADIFLFTSDRNEGWGAVLNESMNSGCAVIANKAIGSVPYLLSNRVNGLVYADGNVEELISQTKSCVKDREFREKLGRNAYETIQQFWSPYVAAQRIIHVSEQLLAGKKIYYEDGACSRALWR